MEGIQILSRRYLFGNEKLIDTIVQKGMVENIDEKEQLIIRRNKLQILLTVCNQIKHNPANTGLKTKVQ